MTSGIHKPGQTVMVLAAACPSCFVPREPVSQSNFLKPRASSLDATLYYNTSFSLRGNNIILAKGVSRVFEGAMLRPPQKSECQE
jgi:hypothetical protein